MCVGGDGDDEGVMRLYMVVTRVMLLCMVMARVMVLRMALMRV